jgi:hypothetical protein
MERFSFIRAAVTSALSVCAVAAASLMTAPSTPAQPAPPTPQCSHSRPTCPANSIVACMESGRCLDRAGRPVQGCRQYGCERLPPPRRRGRRAWAAGPMIFRVPAAVPRHRCPGGGRRYGRRLARPRRNAGLDGWPCASIAASAPSSGLAHRAVGSTPVFSGHSYRGAAANDHAGGLIVQRTSQATVVILAGVLAVSVFAVGPHTWTECKPTGKPC